MMRRWGALACLLLLSSGCAMTGMGLSVAVGRGTAKQTPTERMATADVRGVEILGELSDAEVLELLRGLLVRARAMEPRSVVPAPAAPAMRTVVVAEPASSERPWWQR